MTRLSDYRNRMTLSKFADEEIEQLISHQIATDPELASLAGLLADFRSENFFEPSPADIDRVARGAASVVRSLPEPVRSAPVRQRQRNVLSALRTYSATAVALLALVVFSGLGLTANAAVPGDFLYGLDVAMERVGIGAGSLQERISEGQVLADRGQHGAAAEHLEASISSFGQQATAEDLMRAVEALDGYEDIVDGNEAPDNTPPPPNENAGPGNNNAGGNNETNENTGPGNNAGGNNETNENAGPGNNNAGGNNSETPDGTPPPPNENAGPGNNNAGGNNKTPDETPPPPDEDAGSGNNNSGGNNETNENAGPGNNNAGGNGKGGN